MADKYQLQIKKEKVGEGSVTINELGSILNYPEKRVTLNINDIYELDKTKLSYIKLNDIQTEDLTIGDITFEVVESTLLAVDTLGVITPKSVRNSKSKNNRRN